MSAHKQSVSLPLKEYLAAERRRKKWKFPKFSAYVQALIRADLDSVAPPPERQHLTPKVALTTKTKRSGRAKKKGRNSPRPNVDAEVAAVIAAVAEQVQPSPGAPAPRQNDATGGTSQA